MLLMAPKEAAPSLLERRHRFGKAAPSLEAPRVEASVGEAPSGMLPRRGRPAALRLDCGRVASEAAEASARSEQTKEVPDGTLEQYELLETLGQGTTGVVYAATQRRSGQHVALKVMRMEDEELLETARKEYEMLRSLRHPHIIRAVDFFRHAQGAVLVMERFAGSTLQRAIFKTPERRLAERSAQRLFAALLQSVSYLHQQGIIHRDVKAENILVSEELDDLKLVDFNTAQSTLDGALTMTGTADYMPPEVLLGESHQEASDVWAIGVCLRFMLTGALPLRRRLFSSHQDFGRALLEAQPWPSPPGSTALSPSCLEVLQKCLTNDLQKRPAAAELAECAWLQELAA